MKKEYSKMMSGVMDLFTTISRKKSEISNTDSNHHPIIVKEIEILHEKAMQQVGTLREQYCNNFTTQMVVGDIEKKLTLMINSVRKVG